MATAITAIFGANSTQFQAELGKMQAMAVASAARINAATAHSGHAGTTGMVREGAVIGREIAMGRGMGRILGSLTLLTQYIGTASRASKQARSIAWDLSEAYEKQALKCDMAAIAAAKKAQALGIEAEMEGFECDATIAAADANALEADTARAAAAALRQKAAATAADAAAEDALAASSAKAGMGMMGMVTVFALMVVIIAEAYVIFKGLSEILGRVSKAQLEAAKWANEHRLAVWEEIEAMEKLKDASEKTTEALHRMNEAKDHSVELTQEAIEAAKNEADAKEKLYDASVKSKILDVEIAEKRGLMSPQQAAQAKADIESASIADKAGMVQNKLDSDAKITGDALKNATVDKLAAQRQVMVESDKINNSPEGIAKAKALAQNEKDLAAAQREAEQAKKDEIEYNKGGSNILWSASWKAKMEGYSGTPDKAAALKEDSEAKANAAASAEIRVNSLKRNMSPDEKALADATRIATEKTNAAVTLETDARKAQIAASTNAKNSPAQVAAEQANIMKEAQKEMIVSDKKGYELNSQQKIGGYASTPPEWKTMIDLQRRTADNTQFLRPSGATAPGNKKPQLGPLPGSHHTTGGI